MSNSPNIRNRDRAINKIIAEQMAKEHRCTNCHESLPDNYPGQICRKCAVHSPNSVRKREIDSSLVQVSLESSPYIAKARAYI